MELFRSDAMRGANRLQGEVLLAPPLSWQGLGIGLALMVGLAILFLGLASYAARVEARGWVVGDRGIVQVLSMHAGTLAALHVHEHDQVRKGQRIARIAFDTTAGASTLELRRALAARQQAKALAFRPAALNAGAAARISGLEAQIHAEHAALKELDGQIAEQRTLLASAEEDLDRARVIAQRGFVSRNDLRLREETRAERHQGLLRLQQDRIDCVARIAMHEADQRHERADLAIARLDVARAQGELAAQAAAESAQPWIDVVAPADGLVTGVDGSPGMAVERGRPLLSIIPSGSRLLVRLAIPAEGAGSIRAGQPVAVSIDAYPREIFGTITGRIQFITSAAVPIAGATDPRFLADARLDRSFLKAYGVNQPIRPGMSVKVTIITQRLSLMRWLLDPIYAVIGR